MTRWAKSGSSQKHQKMPEDPTPWEELAMTVKKLGKESFKNKSSKQETEERRAQQDVNNHSAEENNAFTQKLEINRNVVSKKQLKKLNVENKKKQKVKLNSEFIDQFKGPHLDSDNSNQDCDINENLTGETESSKQTFPTGNDEIVVENILTKKHLKQAKLEKKKKKQKLTSNAEVPDQFPNENLNVLSSLGKETGISLSETSEEGSKVFADQENRLTTDKFKSKKQLKKLKLENKKMQGTTLNVESFNQAINKNSDNPNNLESSSQLSSVKRNSRKKELFLQRLQKRRAENGITLLSPKMERKLYMIKRRLREKGFTPEMIKDIIRKERRKAEIELRNPSVNKTCFNCRQLGHVLADCPLPSSNGSNQKTGICFKCGSTEHTSFRCTKKISGYPFASCFICKKSGHISRDCPDNKHGVYIRGGTCNLCGNVNHFRKDCPSLNIKEKEETSAVVHTIFEGTSIDDEITEFKGKPVKKKKFQKTKIVKF